MCMNVTFEQLKDDLKNAGISCGDILVVHSSLRSIGWVDGGAETVVDALLSAVGVEGAVLLPALTFDGSVTTFLHSLKDMRIDLRQTISHNGAIAQAAQKRDDAIMSVHPTHPVVGLGRKAKPLLQGSQSGQGPCGIDSPFYKSAVAGCKILLIGVDLSKCTTLHCVEEISAPYMSTGDVFDVTTVDLFGNEFQYVVKGYPVGLARTFTAIEPRLLSEGIMKMHKLGAADLRIVDGKRLIRECTAWMQAEPWVLACQGAPC